MSFKEILKRIFPPPVHAFNREVERVLQVIWEEKKEFAEQIREVQKELETLQAEQLLLKQYQKQVTQSLERAEQAEPLLLQLNEEWKRQQAEVAEKWKGIVEKQEEISEKVQKTAEIAERSRREATTASRRASEAVWAQIFNNTIARSTWLKDPSFSPGRWAVGYPYLYVMYRVLNETRPKRILELGLGQSTRMIAQYAATFDDVEHIVVEHDPEWIQFFCNSFQLPVNSKIVPLELEMVQYKDAEAVRVFKGFKEAFQGQKFDFISVDAPLGSDMKQYARIDVLNLIPDGLSDTFVIMVDDCNRAGESRTVREVQGKLTASQFENQVGWYNGDKSSVLFCSKQMGFLCSM